MWYVRYINTHSFIHSFSPCLHLFNRLRLTYSTVGSHTGCHVIPYMVEYGTSYIHIWLYGFGRQNEGVVWRVVEKEVRERGCNLFRSFAWTFYAWSIPFVSKYNMSNKRKTAPSVKYGEMSKFYCYSCIHKSFFWL